MAIDTDVELHPLGGQTVSLADQTQLFHLVAVVLDPYENESAWMLKTAARILHELSDADCRVAWIVTSNEEDARTFLGPHADNVLTFCDPDRDVVKALDISEIPALIHVGTNQELVGLANGWNAETWKPITNNLAEVLSWNRPGYPKPNDPGPFAGSPALG